MIKHLLIKDWKLLWPVIALVTAVQIGREWAVYGARLFGESPAAEALLRPLTLAWFLGIAGLTAVVVHQDPIPGVDQDWLIRPLRRSDLLLAKVSFVTLAIGVPMVALDLAHAWAMHMPIGQVLAAILAKELFVLAAFVIPVLALASATRTLTELLFLAAALMVIYALSVGMRTLQLGDGWCPTCHTGMAWLQHLLQHSIILLGACLVLGLQYFRRESAWSRGFAVVGAASLAFLQLSWNSAFAIERWVSGPAAGAENVSLELGPRESLPAAAAVAPAGDAPDARRAAQRLMQGEIDRAVEDLRRDSHDSIALDLPVRARLAANEMLLVDRLQVRLLDGEGRLLYSALTGSGSPELLRASGEDVPAPFAVGYQTIRIPAQAYRRITAMPGRLELEYFVTRVRLSAEYRVAADNGRLQASEVGVCGARSDRNTVSVRCKTIGQAPFCYSATLYAADGQHDSEVFKCEPDYRRHWPALVEVLDYYGVDVPLRDRYGVVLPGVASFDLATSSVRLRVYSELDHFERTISVAPFQPQLWLARTP